jgi:hypothetical protein
VIREAGGDADFELLHVVRERVDSRAVGFDQLAIRQDTVGYQTDLVS